LKRTRHRRKSKSGLPPGTLVYTGARKMEDLHISLMTYSEQEYKEYAFTSMEEMIKLHPDLNGKIWLNIDGLHDESSIDQLCSYFGIHRLTAEDILNIGQRPKLEEHSSYLHIVVKMLMLEQEDHWMDEEQISFILLDNMLITFQEKTGDVFEGVRKRIRDGKGLIRHKSTDYLVYALLDAVVDHYYIILEKFGDRLESVEAGLLEDPHPGLLSSLHLLRRDALTLRRSIYPMREVVSRFEKIEEPVVNKDVKIFIRDLYDHTLQVLDTVEVFREMCTGLVDLYMNTISNKMNEIMKVLTIIATIFIPLTFLAGVYGMNFDNMPELHHPYGYFIIWGIMILVFVGMMLYFKRKRWL